MYRLMLSLLCVLAVLPVRAQLPDLDSLVKSGLNQLKAQPAAKGKAGTDDKTSIAGIKEALAVGTRNAVKSLSRDGGYLNNDTVRILMPEKVRKVADFAAKAGMQKQVDEFVVSMNRAAEAAVPVAADYFSDAIRDMSVDDARGILTGGNTAATEFFKSKTHDKLYTALKPIVARKVGEVGSTKAYKDLLGKVQNIPFLGGQSLDLEDYVTNQALDGLFQLVGEEEKKIRSNPAARVTDLLKNVFGK